MNYLVGKWMKMLTCQRLICFVHICVVGTKKTSENTFEIKCTWGLPFFFINSTKLSSSAVLIFPIGFNRKDVNMASGDTDSGVEAGFYGTWKVYYKFFFVVGYIA